MSPDESAEPATGSTPERPAGVGAESAASAASAANLLADARAWLAQDPDEETRDELRELIEAAESGSSEAVTQLRSRFSERLEFGTAGLRGELAAGPNRMNRVLVAQAAAGFAAFLLERAHPGQAPSIVIGYDARKNSDVFARDTAELMAGAGVRAIILPRLLPTPVLAFAVRHLAASAGVMVTASHNPPRDNGYKVYLGDADHGSQIVSPQDSEIAAHILRVAAEQNVLELPRSTEYETAPESVIDEYVAATARSVPRPSAQLSVVYTAMHGVGWETAQRVFQDAGFVTPVTVDEQIAPDAAFPTVAFPNPEEPGAMDLAFARAGAVNAELVIANDPDADRLAIAIPDDSAGAAGNGTQGTDGAHDAHDMGGTRNAGYRRLTGNEVGFLLGWQAAERADGPDGALACTIVSSPALRAVAKYYRLDFSETLTGFKWVSRVPGLVYGYEEALGYLVNPDTVRDKDGISAALAFLSLAAELKAQGLTIADKLDQFTERFGHFASDQISIRVTDVSEITRIMAKLRFSPPSRIGDIQVNRIDDLANGFGALLPSNVLRIWMEDSSRVMVRPSGTEPKLKVYIDASSTDGSVAERRMTAESRVARLAEGMKALLA